MLGIHLSEREIGDLESFCNGSSESSGRRFMDVKLFFNIELQTVNYIEIDY